MRRLWVQPFSEKHLFEECVRDSVTQLRGEVTAAAAIRQKRKEFPPPGKPGETPQKEQKVTDPNGSRLTPYQVAAKSNGFDPSITTAKTTEDGREICKWYNHASCKFASNCNKAHVCDRVVDGKVCGSNQHTRLTHP